MEQEVEWINQMEGEKAWLCLGLVVEKALFGTVWAFSQSGLAVIRWLQGYLFEVWSGKTYGD